MSEKFELKIDFNAKIDILEAIDWYESQVVGLGNSFEAQLEYCLDLTSKNPLHYQILFEYIGGVSLKRFPYSVYYFLIERTVMVIGFVHMKQLLSIWQERK